MRKDRRACDARYIATGLLHLDQLIVRIDSDCSKEDIDCSKSSPET